MRKSTLISVLIGTLSVLGACKKNNKATPRIEDIDGNIYDVVRIGTQNWMKQNLKTMHYRDGSGVAEIKNDSTWKSIGLNNDSIPAWCYYNNDSANNATYGKLYNWYAVSGPRQLCPVGWHVASDTDWHKLALTLDSTTIWNNTYNYGYEIEGWYAGGSMKAITLWTPPNTGATNSSGLTLLGGGNRDLNGLFIGLGTLGDYWTSTQFFLSSNPKAWYRGLANDTAAVGRGTTYQVEGFSVRCVGD